MAGQPRCVACRPRCVACMWDRAGCVRSFRCTLGCARQAACQGRDGRHVTCLKGACCVASWRLTCSLSNSACRTWPRSSSRSTCRHNRRTDREVPVAADAVRGHLCGTRTARAMAVGWIAFSVGQAESDVPRDALTRTHGTPRQRRAVHYRCGSCSDRAASSKCGLGHLCRA